MDEDDLAIVRAMSNVIDKQAAKLETAQRDRGRLLAWLSGISRAKDIVVVRQMADAARAGEPAPSRKKKS
jgi:hypothetical protein